MKFMKLGSRPDAFCSLDHTTRSVASEIPTDITILVDSTTFLLHKYPLLCKCSYLKNLHRSNASSHLTLASFPGGASAFELCAKFCYGMTITLSAANIVAAMAAAAHLEMSDEQEQGNLLPKLESFLVSCLLRRWKDAITTLHATKKLPLYSEQLDIPGRCAGALAAMVAADQKQRTNTSSTWWTEDLVELDIRQFSRVMEIVKSKLPGSTAVEALRLYLRRWPPEAEILEKIVQLLPDEKGCVRFGLLLKMLKFADISGLDEKVRGKLVRRAAVELEDAAVGELAVAEASTVVEVLREFTKSETGGGEQSMTKVGRLVDGWLKQRSTEKGMSVENFVEISEMLPPWARKEHDNLYTAVDLYLQAHPDLDKAGRKVLCRVLDCKKLSVSSREHAMQNERLPLRLVVQVLFFEQARTAASGAQMAEIIPPTVKKALIARALQPAEQSPGNPAEEEWSNSGAAQCGRPNPTTLRMKLAEGADDGEAEGGLTRCSSSSGFKAICLMQDRPKKLLSRLLSINSSICERH